MAHGTWHMAHGKVRWLLAISYLLFASPVFAQVTADVQGLALAGTDPRIIAAKIIRVALGFLGVVVLGLIAYGGFLWMTATGNEEQIEKAKKVLTSSIIGLVIVLSAFSITQFVLSRLLQATQGPGVVTVAVGPGGGGGLPADAFVVRSIDPKGAVAIRNIVAQVVFSRPPTRDQANLEQNVLVTRKDTGARVEVSYSVSGTTLELRPKSNCPSPNERRKCFDGDTDFRVEAKPELLSVAGRNLICGGLAPQCSGEFRTGSGIDVAPPRVEITDPDAGTGVPVDTCVRVQAKVTDDFGLRRVEFYADGALIEDGTVSPAPASNPREALVEIPCWPTAQPAPRRHTLTAKVFDLDDNNATSAGVEVVVRPLHCFNTDSAGAPLKDDEEDGPNCDSEATGPSGCGLCVGATCTNNRDCRSGACVNSRCVLPTTITGVSPGDGQAGTLVTVAGLGFGSAPGKVVFKNNQIATAPAACARATTWSDNYALVGVPEVAETGPIQVETANCPDGNNLCRDRSDDARGPIVPVQTSGGLASGVTGARPPDGSFWVNTVAHPGLCSVASPPNNRAQGLWGTRVELRGVQFGADQGGGNIFFGSRAGAGIANWSDTGATTAVPAMDYGPVPVQMSNREGILSNSLPYTVLSPDAGTLPEIASISPPFGGVGTGITISGRNFGTTLGSVYFVATDGTATLADTSMPSQCGSTWWSPTLITVKVPQGLVSGAFRLYVHRHDGQQSNQTAFEITNTRPGPFLACIRPSGGPLLANVSLYGENLGARPSRPRGLYFTRTDSGSALAASANWIGAFASLTATGGVARDACPTGGWDRDEICAQVPNDRSASSPNVARSGQVLVEQDVEGITRRSNPVAFAVGNCAAPVSDPLHLDCGALTCCGDGSCNSVCPTIATPVSAYGWQFTTAPAPLVPTVIEKCDQLADAGHPEFPPSPSPAAVSGRQSDTDVCVNAQVVVRLSTPVIPATLSANTIKVEKCTGTENLMNGANSFFDGVISGWGPPPAPDLEGAPAFGTQLEVMSAQGQGRAANLQDDPRNWALRLRKLDDDTGPGWRNESGLQQNYEHWFGYQANVIADTNGKTYTATAWMKAADEAAVGKRAGILIQRDGSSLPVDTPQAWQKVSQEITLTENWQPVSASITFDAHTASGFVRVFAEGAPYDLRVPEPAPDPRQLFSVLVDDVQVIGDPCTQVQNNQFAAGNLERAPQDQGFKWFPRENFEPNAWYRVTLLGGGSGIKAAGDRGQAMTVRSDAQTACGNENAAYCFRFKTKNASTPAENLCAVGGIAVTPSPFTARGENEMINYSAVPVAAGDPCVSPRPDSYTWVWQTAGPNASKAAVSYDNTVTPPHLGQACRSDADCAIGTLPACVSGYCAQMGWTTTATALEETDAPPGYAGIQARVGSVAGEGKLTIEFEPPRVISYFPNCGEACRNAEIGAQFNKSMRASASDDDAVTNPANVQLWAVPCGNGVKDAGEDCDDGNIVSGDGCSSVCLNEGTNYLLRCGDGDKDEFEDCDDRNLNSGDGCSEKCLHEGASATCGNGMVDALEDCDDRNTQNGDGCSAQCLHEGTRSDVAICGNGRLDRGEECEASFGGSFEAWCDEQTCLRQGPTEAARCGNGRPDPGEECDPNSALLDTAAKKTLCNAQCQWTGTLRPTASGGQGCGNGRIEIGEDCDDGNLRPGDGCDGNCRNEGSAPGQVAACGNGGTLDPGEDCDDGNITDGDGCSAKCLNEGRPGADCRNGTLEVGEDCDRRILERAHSAAIANAICSAECRNLGTDPVQPLVGQDTLKPNTCGNGAVNDGEDCDGGAYCSANCTHVAGRPPERVPAGNFAFGWDQVRQELTISTYPATPLSGNTFYRVVLRGDNPTTTAVEGVRACRGPDCVEGKGLADNPETTEREVNYAFNWSGGAAPTTAGQECVPGACNTFSWTFRTKNDTCGVGRVDLSPPEASLYVVGAREQFSAVPMGAPDSCNPQGQRLNPLNYSWLWNTVAGSPVRADDIATIVDAQNPAVAPYGLNRIPSCGNGRVDYGEDCDDGNTVSNDGCFGTDAAHPCTNEGSGFAFACGNGRLDPGEECENPDGLLCGRQCLRLGNASCGTGRVQNCCGNRVAEDGRAGRANFGEDCDDGNILAGDGCSPRCLNEGSSPRTGACGNGGTLDPGEECNPNAAGEFTSVTISGATIAIPPTRLLCDPQTCLWRGTWRKTECGNKIVQAGEECEDGNTRSGDGCSARCLREGTKPVLPLISAKSEPQRICGNSRLDAREDCDDGNVVNGDGCSNLCLNEGTLPEQGPVPPATLPETPPRLDPIQQAQARGIAKFCRPLTGTFPPNPVPCVATAECSGNGAVCAPPNPWTTIQVMASAEDKPGNAALTVFCVAASDKDCPVPGSRGSNTDPPGGNTTIGRGTDSCCYARPVVVENTRTPAVGAANVCRNSLLRVAFNQALAPESLAGNFVIARLVNANSCGAGEQELDEQGNLVPPATRTAPVRCVAQDLRVTPTVGQQTANGSEITLQPSQLLGNERENITYRIALIGDKNITDAEVSGLRSISGAGFYGGTTGVDLNWEFTVGKDICTLDEVKVSGGTSFEASDKTALAQATAYTNSRKPAQPIGPAVGYGWEWSWGSADPQVVTVANAPDVRGTVAQNQWVTAGTKNGITQVSATATITEDALRNTVGATIAGRAEFSTFLCENPWPDDLGALYSLADKAPRPLGGSFPTNFTTRYCRDGATVLPSLSYPGAVRIPRVDTGIQTPQTLKEVLLTVASFSDGVDFAGGTQTATSQATENRSFTYPVNFPGDGDYELTLETSNYNDNSDPDDDELGNLSAVLEAKRISDEVRAYLRDGPDNQDSIPGVDVARLTGAYYHRLRIFLDEREMGEVRAKAVSASAAHSQGKILLPAMAKGSHTLRVAWINDDRLPSVLTAVGDERYEPGDIWDANLQIHKLILKRGRIKDDAIGIRVMSNPQRLSVRDWYAQMQLGGQPAPYPTPIDGYEAIREGNTVYIGATNVTPPTVYGNVYLVSVSEGASSEVVRIFDELLKNLAFNANLDNFKTCAVNFCSSNQNLTCRRDTDCGASSECVPKGCSKNLDCAAGDTIKCRADKDKLARDLIRLNHVETITAALRDYAGRNGGRYPALGAGTFIRAMSASRWPSWQTALGAALNTTLPQDPINFFGTLCRSGAGEQGTYDSATCWNELAQTYRCPAGSHVYQYESRGESGYALKTEFELLERPETSPPTWDVDGWTPPATDAVTVLTGGVCQWRAGQERYFESARGPGEIGSRQRFQWRQVTKTFTTAEAGEYIVFAGNYGNGPPSTIASFDGLELRAAGASADSPNLLRNGEFELVEEAGQTEGDADNVAFWSIVDLPSGGTPDPGNMNRLERPSFARSGGGALLRSVMNTSLTGVGFPNRGVEARQAVRLTAATSYTFSAWVYLEDMSATISEPYTAIGVFRDRPESGTGWSNATAACGNRVLETGEECEIDTGESRLVPLWGFPPANRLRCTGDPAVACPSGVVVGQSCGENATGVALGLCQRLTSCQARRTCSDVCVWNPWRSGTTATAAPVVADCSPGGTFCGNGRRDDYNGDRVLDEVCDDGALNGQYGKCNITCTGLGAYCGDGVPSGEDGDTESDLEACDDGTRNGSYGRCRFDCSGLGARCGDGIVDVPNEVCERGQTQTVAARNELTDTQFCGADYATAGTLYATAQTNSAGYAYKWKRSCNTGCAWGGWQCVAEATCGNGEREGSEQCDDGNSDNTDGCIITDLQGPFNAANNCVRAQCGDGFNSGTVCTAGPADKLGDPCTVNEQCGVGGVCQDPEECDAGSSLNGQSCDAPYNGNCTSCDLACNIVTRSGGFCGDTIWQSPDEQCEGAAGLAADSTGALPWVCRGTVGDNEKFWNFKTLEGWVNTSQVTLSLAFPGYHSNSALKIVWTGNSDGHRAYMKNAITDTQNKSYIVSGWINTRHPASYNQTIQFDFKQADVPAPNVALEMDANPETWQYWEKTLNLGPSIEPLEIRVALAGGEREILIDQVHVRPANPTCVGNTCTRQCRGGSVCQNVLKRCERGARPGAECASDADCNPSGATGGVCRSQNFDRPGPRTINIGGAATTITPYRAYDPQNPPLGYDLPVTNWFGPLTVQRIGDLVADICDTDQDNDGYPAGGAGLDCNDQDARVNPDMAEVCDDDLDSDCDGLGQSADASRPYSASNPDNECRGANILVADFPTATRAGPDADRFQVYLNDRLIGPAANGTPVQNVSIPRLLPGDYTLRVVVDTLNRDETNDFEVNFGSVVAIRSQSGNGRCTEGRTGWACTIRTAELGQSLTLNLRVFYR